LICKVSNSFETLISKEIKKRHLFALLTFLRPDTLPRGFKKKEGNMKKVGLSGMLFVLVAISMGCAGSQKALVLQPGPMPEGASFDGIYQSDFGRLELTGDGSTVQGLFEDDQHHGRLQGQVEGSLLKFTWTQWTEDMQGRARESKGRGVFKYIVEIIETSYKPREDHRLEGIWGYDKDPLVNAWNAYRLSDRAKRQLQPHDMKPDKEMPGASEYDDGQGFADGEAPEPADEEETSSEVQF
jgi:hypothetical protein